VGNEIRSKSALGLKSKTQYTNFSYLCFLFTMQLLCGYGDD